jgi:hypothetical protein
MFLMEWHTGHMEHRNLPLPAAGGMSKTTMALLALLAHKAYKGLNCSPPAQPGAPSRYPSSQSAETYNPEPGGLAGVLRTIFGGGAPCPVPC